MTFGLVVGKDERIRQHAPDRVWVDVVAFGRDPPATALVPIIEQCTDRCVFHGPTLSRLLALLSRKCPGLGRTGGVARCDGWT